MVDTFGVCNHAPGIVCAICSPIPPYGYAKGGWVNTTTFPTTPVVDHRRVAATRAVADLLDALGVPRDEHTADTPSRVAKSFLELLSGYDEDPALHLDRQFPGPEDAGIVVLSGIRFTSLCAHHLLPFSGTGTVAYLPMTGQPIVGLSKLARVLEGYSRRLQTQEVLGAQVADALDAKLQPMGAACILTSHHDCMGIRGVRQPDAVMTTSSLRGTFQNNAAQRAELMALHQS
jgi:GTP cyclohydrolase IA